mgnify:CR=1 FL=1
MGCTHSELNKTCDFSQNQEVLDLMAIYNSSKFSFSQEEIDLIQTSLKIIDTKELGVDIMTKFVLI